jgi:hypothetical protein
MVTEKEVLERKQEMSDKISTQVRTVGIGLLAFTWGLLVSDSAIARSIAEPLKWHLLVISLLAILVVFLDFFQYVLGHETARKLIRQMERQSTGEGQYDYGSRLWKFQYYFFYAKQIGVTVAAVYLLAVILTFLLRKVV